MKGLSLKNELNFTSEMQAAGECSLLRACQKKRATSAAAAMAMETEVADAAEQVSFIEAGPKNA